MSSRRSSAMCLWSVCVGWSKGNGLWVFMFSWACAAEPYSQQFLVLLISFFDKRRCILDRELGEQCTQIYTSVFSFFGLSRPLARPPGAGRLEVEEFGWAWDRILRRKCSPGPWARARAGPWLGPSISSSIFGPKPIQILQLPASQPLEAALAAD